MVLFLFAGNQYFFFGRILKMKQKQLIRRRLLLYQDDKVSYDTHDNLTLHCRSAGNLTLTNPT